MGAKEPQWRSVLLGVVTLSVSMQGGLPGGFWFRTALWQHRAAQAAHHLGRVTRRSLGKGEAQEVGGNLGPWMRFAPQLSLRASASPPSLLWDQPDLMLKFGA